MSSDIGWLDEQTGHKFMIMDGWCTISQWMGSCPISLDIGLVLLVFGSSFGLAQIRHRLVQYPEILDGYPSNKIENILTCNFSFTTPSSNPCNDGGGGGERERYSIVRVWDEASVDLGRD